MRKLIHIVLLVLAMHPHGWAITNYGWVTGLGFSSFKSLPNHEVRIHRPGLRIGYTVEKPFYKNLSVSAALLYAQLGANMNKLVIDSLGLKKVSTSYNIEYLTLPVSLRLQHHKHPLSIRATYALAYALIANYRSYETLSVTQKLSGVSPWNHAIGVELCLNRRSIYDFKYQFSLGYLQMLQEELNSSRAITFSIAFLYSHRTKRLKSSF